MVISYQEMTLAYFWSTCLQSLIASNYCPNSNYSFYYETVRNLKSLSNHLNAEVSDNNS